MKKVALIFFICIAVISAKAQDAVLFKIKYMPAKSYKMAMKMDMGMDMYINGDSATTAKMKAEGVKQPIVMKMNTVNYVDIKTGPLTAKKTYSFTMTSKPGTTNATMNGANLPLPKTATSAQIFKGECNADGKVFINSTSGGTANAEVKAAVIAMLNKLQGEIKFPEKPMTIGESFTMDVPMNIPANGINVDAMVKSTYTLMAIKEGNAYFDTNMSMNMDVTTQKEGLPIKMKGQGSGSGKLVYSIKNNFTWSLNSDMTMDLNMVIKEVNMDMKMNMRSDIQNTIAAVR